MIETVIRCSVCDILGDSAGHPTPAHVIRKRLKKLGWKCGRAGGTDYCPRCWDQYTGERKGVLSE